MIPAPMVATVVTGAPSVIPVKVIVLNDAFTGAAATTIVYVMVRARCAASTRR
jgi:hypothetical protein